MSEDDVPAAVPRAVWIVGALAVALTVLVTWLVVGVAHVGRDDVAAGTIYQGGQSEQTFPTSATVQLPGSTMTVQLTRPRDHLPHDFAEFDVDGPQLPPVDGTWVGIKWASRTLAQAYTLAAELGPLQQQPVLAARTGGHSYALTTAGQQRVFCRSTCGSDGELWLAIDGDGGDLAVAVTYDGVTQTVDARTGRITQGRAAALYAAAASSNRACGTPTLSSGFRGDYLGTCGVSVLRTPWLPGLGWAAANQEWTVAVVSVPERISVVGDGQRYTAAYNAETADLATTGLRLVRRIDLAPGELHADDFQIPATTLVYSGAHGAAARMTITVRYPLSPDGIRPITTRNADVTATWTVSL